MDDVEKLCEKQKDKAKCIESNGNYRKNAHRSPSSGRSHSVASNWLVALKIVIVVVVF